MSRAWSGPRHPWTHDFRERPWGEIREFLAAMVAAYPEYQHMTDVVDSVLDSGAAHLLAGSTSMHDLIVVPRPVGRLVTELIAVRAPSSLRHVPPGRVLVEHWSSTWRNDSIERPSVEAVAVFWRFVIEKYGIRPGG